VEDEGGIAIVLPWDPSFGDDALPSGHVLATPPSKFVWNGSAWRAM
jgi:hypothetical protein